MGTIRINRMQFHTCHGALPHEKHVAQEFWVDLTLQVNLARAGQTDRLRDTVNYAMVVSSVAEIMMGPSVKLLETLAFRIYETVRGLDDRIEHLEVRVTKVDPPIGVPSAGVVVTIADGE
ncbi:MAG: dihydroneopterin aldolase [Sulfobacillus acidophilus]|uniref:7,8-dihydroneopterin aldolase n=1 Tax=Sulfobacillus acidophilus TaxID=53633 RepID=A0A2T2WGF2_9FIRM|nr:MAG: dihydroneopterin aldolase [Sulfobacillus acidophilus]